MNLQTIFKFCCCVIICLIPPTATTTITPTSNEVLFKPLGQLIPELSWGTVRVHINMSDIFTETNYICNASRLMDTEWAKMKRKYGSGFSGIPPTKLNSRSAYLSESLTKDIVKMCEENSRRVQEIIEVYHLNKLQQPDHLHFNTKHINPHSGVKSLVRNVRQVIIGAAMATIGIITSLVSIFTSTELIKMSSSEDSDDDLIDNNNHIITSLQSHENAINRNEESIKEIKEHVYRLEKHLSLEKQTTDVYLNLFNIRLYGTSASHHLQRMQDGLFSLLENKLSPKLVPLKTIEPIVEKLRKVTRKRGYNLAINSISDVFMCDTSFVAYETGELIILVHIPMYKNLHLMKLLEYQSTPIILSNQTDQQLFINPVKPIIAVDNDLTLYAVYDKAELHHDCKSIHDNFYCENKNILKRTSSSDCTLALYRRLKDEIRTKCPIELTKPQEVIIQINSTTFYVFSPNTTDVFVTCPERVQEKRKLKGFNIVTLIPGCRAALNHHVFSSGILVEENIDLKQNNLHLNLMELSNIDDLEEKELIDLIKEEQTISTKPLQIVDVEKKYKLRRIQKRNKFFGTLFGSFSSIITFVILIIIGVLVYRCIRKKAEHENHGKGDTFVNYNTPSDKFRLTSTPDTTRTSAESEDDGVEIRLFSTPVASTG